MVALGGCGSQTGAPADTQRAGRAAIERYMGEVEPIRLAVNKLLGGADPNAGAARRLSNTAPGPEREGYLTVPPVTITRAVVVHA